jgi:multidrug efflux pump subunit AcrA (membrane-fusion protein)
MFGRVRHAGGTQQLPVVDESAVLRRDAKTLVYVEESPGRFQEREVTLGPRVGRRLSVTSGLQAGERVVVEGSIYLRNGS